MVIEIVVRKCVQMPIRIPDRLHCDCCWLGGSRVLGTSRGKISFMTVQMFLLVALFTTASVSVSSDIKPPMGWRSWNLYGDDVRTNSVHMTANNTPFECVIH